MNRKVNAGDQGRAHRTLVLEQELHMSHADLRSERPALHWGASGFANTDLDFLLKQLGVVDLFVVGLLANTCIEGTARFAAELGYRVVLVRDATAAFSQDCMHAAHELNGPTFAHAIVTTAEAVAALRGGSFGRGDRARERERLVP